MQKIYKTKRGGKKDGAGRPEVEDKKVSVTASVKMSDKAKIEKKYGSLTNAVQTEIIPKLKKQV